MLVILCFWFLIEMHVSNLIEASKLLIRSVLEAEIIDITLLYIFDELIQFMFLVQPTINSIEMLSCLLIDLWIDVVGSIHEVLVVDLVVCKDSPSEKIILFILFFSNAFEMFEQV